MTQQCIAKCVQLSLLINAKVAREMAQVHFSSKTVFTLVFKQILTFCTHLGQIFLLPCVLDQPRPWPQAQTHSCDSWRNKVEASGSCRRLQGAAAPPRCPPPKPPPPPPPHTAPSLSSETLHTGTGVYMICMSLVCQFNFHKMSHKANCDTQYLKVTNKCSPLPYL